MEMCSLFLVTLKEAMFSLVTSLSDKMSNILHADIYSSEDFVIFHEVLFIVFRQGVELFLKIKLTMHL